MVIRRVTFSSLRSWVIFQTIRYSFSVSLFLASLFGHFWLEDFFELKSCDTVEKVLKKLSWVLNNGGRKSSLGPGNKSIIFGLDARRKNNFMIKLNKSLQHCNLCIVCVWEICCQLLKVTNSYCSVCCLFYVWEVCCRRRSSGYELTKLHAFSFRLREGASYDHFFTFQGLYSLFRFTYLQSLLYLWENKKNLYESR